MNQTSFMGLKHSFLAAVCCIAIAATSALVHAAPDAALHAPAPTAAELAFNAWARKYADSACDVSPDSWELAGTSGAPFRPLSHGMPDTNRLTLIFRTKRAVQMGAAPAREETVQISIVRRMRHLFVPPPAAPRLTRVPIGISRSSDRMISYFVGSNDEATFYSEWASPEVWIPFLDEMKKHFGIANEYTSVDDLLHELAYGRPGEPLYRLIASRPKAEKLRLARFLVTQLRQTDPFMAVSDETISRVLNVNLTTPALKLGTWLLMDEKTDRRGEATRETADAWDAWIRWAEDKTEEEWMTRALEETIDFVRKSDTFASNDRIAQFFNRALGPNFPEARFSREYETKNFGPVVALYDANKDRLVWNKQLQHFEIKPR